MWYPHGAENVEQLHYGKFEVVAHLSIIQVYFSVRKFAYLGGGGGIIETEAAYI
jgi:hypothetical protein